MSGSYPSPTFDALTLNSALPVASGGTGATTVAGIAGAISANFYVATIAALRALTSATTATTASVAGYAAAADGGGGIFVVNAADTTSADNGGTIIVDAAGRRWYRQYENALSVKWFGAKGDNTTDDTTAIQNAINALPPSGVLFVPPGRYLLSNQITISTPGVAVIGAGWSSAVTVTPTAGTIFVCSFAPSVAANVFYVTGSNIGFENLEIWPNYQPAAASGWTPVATPNAIQFYRSSGAATGGDDGRITNVMIRGMSIGVYYFGADRGRVQGLYGQTFGPLLNVDGSYDVLKVHDFHYWVFFSSDTNILDYVQQNISSIYFGRVDNPEMTNIFSFNCHEGLQYGPTNTTAGGGSQRGQFANVCFDNCYYGIVLASDGLVTFEASNLAIYCSTSAGTATAPTRGIYQVSTQIANAQITNFDCAGSQGEAIRFTVSGSLLQLDNANIESYNQVNNNFNAIYADTGVTAQIGSISVSKANGNNVVPFGGSGSIGIASRRTQYANYETWTGIYGGDIATMARCFGRVAVSVTATGYTTWSSGTLPVTYNTALLWGRATLGSLPTSAAVDIFDGQAAPTSPPVSGVSGELYAASTGTVYVDYEVVGVL
ncbi:glycosyl hydrolase family 28-related protein [Acidiphilium sp.]|uniref:glycosyl hydrolase family 28-related protein n=2 Tax=unclassified Acidiphilium TaxID=2617493 RepID=UPI002B814F18|nr:glycosyl hydrolase family 28-related protein [Acidiphilium sp.]HQT62197.1 glycosyl hydrolase family 28-related protein [Acidiphilium sp.]